MWHIATVLRERKSLLVAQAVKASRYTTRFQHNGGGATVAIQLDYYMSIQFAGVANALVNNKYSERGIDLTFLPTCPVGLEQERTRLHQNAYPKAISIGSVEQNIFVPTLAQHPGLKTTAVAAMFRKSPLCVASLQNLEVTAGEMMTIAAHEDTVELLQRIFPHCKVVASPRATKNSDLLTGKYDGIQAYMTTEVPTLRRQLGKEPAALALEGYKGTKLGYSQVLFAADECLADDRREVVQAFLEATFEGWEQAIHQDPALTVQAVKEAQWMLGLDDEHNDHWHRSSDFDLEMLQLINDHVKETYEGDRYGVIHPTRWSQANHWLLQDKPSVEENFGLDATVWQPPKQLLSGHELGRSLLEDAKESASAFRERYGRKPSLAVITVGDLARYTDAKRHLQLYSNKSNSWFSKTATGAANGFDVKEIQLDASATTDELLSEIYAAKGCDGIQLMWPLPEHIIATKVYNAIAVAKDVDGIHYVGQLEIGNKKAHPPVTAAGTLALMKQHGVDVKGKRVLVIGRSPIVGSPVAHMIRAEGGAMTVAHTDVSTELLKQLVGEADVIVTCAGSPGLIQADWIKNNAQVINAGSTFLNETDSLHSDVAGDISANAARYSPVPGGIGPLSLPFLLQNTVRAAWSRMDGEGRMENTWGRTPATLTKSFHFKDYTSALDFAQKLDEMSTVMDHHASMTFSHRCVDGVDVTLEFFTFEANALTEKDYDAAKVADMVYCGNAVKMSDFTYDLKEESIAKYPATPRGSSKLLRVDGNGNVSYYSNFAESFGSLVKGAHVVFNESRKLEARLFVVTPSEERAELVLLDLGKICATQSCDESLLVAMIRVQDVSDGDVFMESSGEVEIEVVSVERSWEEEAKCFVRVHTDLSVNEFLVSPYFRRLVEISDKEAYNSEYATDGGSVAAPTAGLHFTKKLLSAIGEENCSFLSLHIGAGTYKPVMSDDARDHEMQAESFSVSVRELRNIIKALESGKPLVVVGTTSCRTLESLFWCGVKRVRGFKEDTNHLELKQFEWIPLTVGEGKNISPSVALRALVDGKGDDEVVSGWTSLMITPDSYDFKVCDHLVTNFHAPDSTLMLLLSAFMKSGSKIKQVYEDAQEKGYRFLSYGDSCMFSRPGSK